MIKSDIIPISIAFLIMFVACYGAWKIGVKMDHDRGYKDDCDTFVLDKKYVGGGLGSYGEYSYTTQEVCTRIYNNGSTLEYSYTEHDKSSPY